MRKQASRECRSAFYTAKGIGNGFENEVEPEAEFLRRDKEVEMEITHRAVLIFVVMAVHAEVLCFFLVGVVMRAFAKVLMAKSMKRLVGCGKEHNSHQGQIE